MPRTEAVDQLIPLRGGFACRASVVFWLIAASDRLRFAIKDDGKLSVAPRTAITSTDDVFIRAHRDELLACVKYVEQQSMEPL